MTRDINRAIHMIPILPATAWREFRGEPKQKGLNQTTHLAMIEDASGKLHRCYVKGTPPGWPTPLTEAIGWILAGALNLPRPEFAALVMVPLDKLRQNMRMDQHWLRYPEMLSFCASSVDGKTASQGWQWLAQLRTKRIFKRPEVSRVGAFDCWVNNQDRNTGNLIIKRDGDCVPIDNEFILYSLLWQGRVPFTVTHNSLLNEAQRILKSAPLGRFKIEMARDGKQHLAAFNNAAPNVQQAVQSLVPDPATASALNTQIQQYLISRADPAWLPTQLGVIV